MAATYNPYPGETAIFLSCIAYAALGMTVLVVLLRQALWSPYALPDRLALLRWVTIANAVLLVGRGLWGLWEQSHRFDAAMLRGELLLWWVLLGTVILYSVGSVAAEVRAARGQEGV